jgi:hypothetical protein
MNAFIVSLDNKPGELARVAEAISNKGIDITSFGGVTCGGDGTVAFLTNDEAGTRRALSEAKCRVREIEVVSASVENRPGGLAALARKLADAGLNVEAAIPTAMSGSTATIAIATNDPMRARSVVGMQETVRAGMG